MTVDYLIVGQGIAGTMLAHFLVKEGKTVTVIDNPKKSSSSWVAAGIYNPVVFKRMTKSWKADILTPFALKTYQDIHQEFGVNPLIDKPVLKLFANPQEKKLWEQAWQEGDLDRYITDEVIGDPYPEHIHSPFGASVVMQSGAVDIAAVRGLVRKQVSLSGNFYEEDFNVETLKLLNDGVQWKDITAQKIIFCEGHLSDTNPYFNWLPMKATKGEILIVEVADFEPQYIINRGCFMMPLGNNLFKVGATFEWQELNENPTTKGREELEEKLKVFLKTPYKIIDQQAGIRPTVNDRRPLIGLHPEHPQLGIFNGMGTKGVMLAPYFAQQFVQHLLHGTALMVDGDIGRFK